MNENKFKKKFGLTISIMLELLLQNNLSTVEPTKYILRLDSDGLLQFGSISESQVLCHSHLELF